MIDAINDINRSMTLFVEIWCIPLFVFGVVGHALSIYVFTRREFRSNSCTRYFLASTISGCGVVYLLVPARFLETGYNISIFISSILLCQILTYIFLWLR